MANFHTHLTIAATASVALSTLGAYTKLFGITTGVLCAVVGTLGGLLPDIDLDHSTPAKHGFLVGSLVVSTLLVIFYANAYRQDELLLDSLILWTVSFVIVRFGILATFSRLTVHRGMVHSVPYMAMFALVLTCGAFYGLKMTAFVSWVLGLFLFVGALVHLVLDEIYSVNVFGMRLKKSSGTALKFFERKKPIAYAVLYLIIIALVWLAPPCADTLMSIKKAIIGII